MNRPDGRVGPSVALVTDGANDPTAEDDRRLTGILAGHGITTGLASWDSPEADWDSFDRVVIRSTGDLAGRLEDFLVWCDRIGPDRLRNSPDLIRWNSDRRYLAELDGSGLPVPPTLLVAPLGAVPELYGDVVVRPVAGSPAGASGRFSPEQRAALLDLLERLGRQDRIAMIQPYYHEVEQIGESRLTFLGGEFAFARKDRPGGEPDPVEVELGRHTVEWIAGKFGRMPLSLRVDTLLTAQGPVLIEVEAIQPGATGDRFGDVLRCDLGLT